MVQNDMFGQFWYLSSDADGRNHNLRAALAPIKTDFSSSIELPKAPTRREHALIAARAPPRFGTALTGDQSSPSLSSSSAKLNGGVRPV